MNKKNIFLIFGGLVVLIFLISFVSAGLCKGSDGYYHDCNDFSDRYYKDNFYPNYKTEYYKETSSSSSSIISIKEDRYSYEEIGASSSAETNIESYKIQRDYSYPKTKYVDRYGRYYYDSDYNDYYEWDNEPHMVVFLNKGPTFSQETDNEDNKNSDLSDWRNTEYRARNYDNAQYDNYYYTPRFSENKGYYNWNW